MTTTRIDLSDLRRFAADVDRFNKQILQAEIHRGLIDASKEVADTARDYASFSTRIPATIVAGRTARSAYVRAGANTGANARQRGRKLSGGGHAGLYEYGSTNSGGKYVRFPLFGNREHWFKTPTKPFLWRAVEDRQEAIYLAIAAGIDRARLKANL